MNYNPWRKSTFVAADSTPSAPFLASSQVVTVSLGIAFHITLTRSAME